MSTVATAERQSRTADLARLSPLVLLAVAMPWLLKDGIVVAVSQFAPAYEPLVTGRLGDAFLYPVVTGTIVLGGLYAFLDPASRRSLFLFRWPSRRELLAVVGGVIGGYLLQSVIHFVAISLFGLSTGSVPGEGFGLRWIVTFVIVSGVFAPLIEEVLFRGLLLGYLIEQGVPTFAAAGVVVVAFAGIHIYGGPVQMAGAAAVAVIAIALRLRYENLVSPVLFHSLFNQVNGLMILLYVAN